MTSRQLIEFLTFAENLKNTLRHAQTTGGHIESVAEHAWMLCLMAVAVFEEIQQPVDQLRVLKMLIIHDLPEALTGDIPTFYKNSAEAHVAEIAALEKILAPLSPSLRAEIQNLFEEFEARQTYEAQLANALDKAEALLQHNLADLSSWDEHDFAYQTDFQNPRWQLFDFDPFIAQFKQTLDQDTIEKIAAADQLDRAHPQAVADYRRQKP